MAPLRARSPTSWGLAILQLVALPACAVAQDQHAAIQSTRGVQHKPPLISDDFVVGCIMILFLMLFAFGARAPATERTTLCAPSLHRALALSLWQANNELSRHAACVPMRPHHLSPAPVLMHGNGPVFLVSRDNGAASYSAARFSSAANFLERQLGTCGYVCVVACGGPRRHTPITPTPTPHPVFQ
jgi:hypothetical protein